MQALHLPRHSFSDDALARRQSAAGIVSESMKRAALGDLAAVDGPVHCRMEAIQIRPGSRGICLADLRTSLAAADFFDISSPPAAH